MSPSSKKTKGNRIVNLETDAKTLNYSSLKLNYSLAIYLKHKKDFIFKQQPQKTHKQDILLKKLSNRSIVLCFPRDAFMNCFVSMRILMGQGCRTRSSQNHWKTMVNINNGLLNVQTFLSGL